MEPGEYAKMASLQRDHWWFDAKRRVMRATLARWVRPAANARYLEIGCGTGAMSPVFSTGGLSVGVDLHSSALAHVEEARPVGGDALRLPFRDRVFDVAGCFDLLYHRGVPDVPTALGEIARVLRPGGWLLITDSACPALYGAHDRAHHGARRFTRAGLREVLAAAAFDVVHDSHLHVAVFPLVWASRVGGRSLRRLLGRREQERGASQLGAVPAPLNAALKAFYALEAPLAARARMPVGVTVVAAARRR